MGTLDPDFEGETAVVTGGTSGIGRETALQFADAGATVLIGDIDREPKLADAPTAEVIREAGGEAAFVETDVSDRSAVGNLVETAREHGGVDVMINNAGIYRDGPVTDLTEADLSAVLAVNVEGVFNGVQAAAIDMLERDEPGTILNTASISSRFAQHGQTAYDASKGAVAMITRTAALELAAEDIRVNAVAPGQIATEFTPGLADRQRELARTGGHLKPVPLGRAGEPADVAGAYLFLASEAAEYVTGELLFVDGGWQVG
jgi:NAD(P)-dependent dehydrogenase (short-subunit alcohol dehydrogenase family)